MTTKTGKYLDTSHHSRRRERRLKDPGFRDAYNRSKEEIGQIDEVIRTLDRLRVEAGLSKADVARAIGKDPASVRRLFTAAANPELKTVVAIAQVLDARLGIEPRGSSSSQGSRDIQAIPHLVDTNDIVRIAADLIQRALKTTDDEGAVKWMDTATLLTLASEAELATPDKRWLKAAADPDGYHVISHRVGLNQSRVLVSVYVKASGTPPDARDNPNTMFDMSWDNYEKLPVSTAETVS